MKILLKKTRLNFFIKISLLILISLFSYLMIAISYPYLIPPFPTNIDFLLTKQDVLSITIWRWAFYIHISTSVFVIIAGLTQFSRTLLRKRPKLHRQIGKLYLIVVLFISGPSGFVMALKANGGLNGQIAFTLLSILWMSFTYLAYHFVRKKEFRKHGNWMFRSYALSLSAVTLRLLIFGGGLLPFYVNYETLYVITAWLSWSLNLGIMEVLIRKGIGNRYF